MENLRNRSQKSSSRISAILQELCLSKRFFVQKVFLIEPSILQRTPLQQKVPQRQSLMSFRKNLGGTLVSQRVQLSCPGRAARALCGLESSAHYLFMCLHADVELR